MGGLCWCLYLSPPLVFNFLFWFGFFPSYLISCDFNRHEMNIKGFLMKNTRNPRVSFLRHRWLGPGEDPNPLPRVRAGKHPMGPQIPSDQDQALRGCSEPLSSPSRSSVHPEAAAGAGSLCPRGGSRAGHQLFGVKTE